MFACTFHSNRRYLPYRSRYAWRPVNLHFANRPSRLPYSVLSYYADYMVLVPILDFCPSIVDPLDQTLKKSLATGVGLQTIYQACFIINCRPFICTRF
jgi:hypothetical protein